MAKSAKEKSNQKTDVKKLSCDVKDALETSCAVKTAFAAKHSETVAKAALIIANALKNGGKVLVCGNGGSAADAQHMTGELLGRYHGNRPPLAAVALTTDTSTLTCIANDYGYVDVFSRQVEALGRKDDVLIAITTSGNSANVIKAMRIAKEKGMINIAMTGKGGAKAGRLADVLIDAPSTQTPRIQETHGAVIHILCDLVETIIFPTL